MNGSQAVSDFNIQGKTALRALKPLLAYDYFLKAENFGACAYCLFLAGNFSQARDILLKVKEESTFDLWLMFLLDLIEGKQGRISYFSVRMFYEQDTDMLLRLAKTETAEKIFRSNEYISRFNGEVYKYAGRVLLNNGYIAYSEEMLKKSLDICYKDPETHFLLCEAAEKRGDLNRAVSEIKTTIEVCPKYKPAENKLEELYKRL